MSAAKFLGLAFVVASASFAFAACGQEAPENKLGPPDGLQGKSPTDVAPDAGAVAVTPPAPTGEGGTTPTGGCAKLADGGTPTFTNDIYPNLFTTAWTCAAATCHVAGTAAASGIDLSTAALAYTNLTAYTSDPDMTPYINAASMDPTKSYIVKDIVTNLAMPQKIGTSNHTATAAEGTELTAWLMCGAPK